MKKQFEYKNGIAERIKPSKDIIALSKRKDTLQEEYWETMDKATDLYQRYKPIMDEWKGLRSKAGKLMIEIMEIRKG